jgi:peptidoglycan/LPS O-acetylase OafA/YrhL
MDRGGRYLGLDGMRGIAAIMVVLFHAKVLALHGYLSVDLFFMMSGFVIARTYEPRFQSGRIDLKAYMLQRLARLYPMLALGGLVGLAMTLAGLQPWAPNDSVDLTLAIVSQFTLIPFLAASTAPFPLNNPQWSIVWELVANFVHARGLYRVGVRMLLPIIAAAAAVLTYYALTEHLLAVGVEMNALPAGISRAAFGFFTGVVLCRTRDRWEPRIPSVSIVIPISVLCLAAMMPPTLVPQGVAFGLYDLFVVTTLFPLLVMLGARARAGKLSEALGHLSYPLYAFTEPLLFYLRLVLKVDHATMLAAIAAMVAVAWILGRWVDAPLNTWRHQAMKARRASLDALPAAA